MNTEKTVRVSEQNTQFIEKPNTCPDLASVQTAVSCLGVKSKEFRRGLWNVKDLDGVKNIPDGVKNIPDGADKFLFYAGCVALWTDGSGAVHINTHLDWTDGKLKTILDLFAWYSDGVSVIPDESLEKAKTGGGVKRDASALFRA